MRIFAAIVLFFMANLAIAADYEDYKLSWIPPDSFSNGDKLSARSDLESYKIYYGPSQEAVRDNSIKISASSNRFSLSGLDSTVVKNSPIIYLAMTAISKTGNESDLSKVIFFLP